ncbi:hypothetical protein D3C85_1193730 [compost metagenome]
MAFGDFRAGQQQRAGPVVDPGGVAGGDAAAFAERRAEFGELLKGSVAAWVFVVLDHLGRAFALGDFHRDDLFGQTPAGLGSGSALLAAQGEGVLVGAGDVELFGDILCRFRHGIDAVGLFHQRIDEAPADGGVEDLGCT